MLLDAFLAGIDFPLLDLPSLYSKGEIVPLSAPSPTGFYRLPSAYSQFIPLPLRLHAWDEAPLGETILVDGEGICHLVLQEADSTRKERKDELDGLQLLVDAIWKEGRTDLFDIPICTSTTHLSFRVLACPMQMWVPGEIGLKPFLSWGTLQDPAQLARWEKVNAQAAQALSAIAKHIPGCGNYPVRKDFRNGDDDTTSLMLSVNRQKLVPYCPLDLVGPSLAEPDGWSVAKVVARISNFESLITSPVVFRSVMREEGIRMRFLGLILMKLELPVLKEIVVGEMIGRSAKWFVRRMMHTNYKDKKPILSGIDVAAVLSSRDLIENRIAHNASSYFKVPLKELLPYIPLKVDPYHVRYLTAGDFSLSSTRGLFPHAKFHKDRSGFYPTVRFLSPRPNPAALDPTGSAIETLPLKYAAKLFQLELTIARGDLLSASAILGEIADTILKMRTIEPLPETKEHMRLKVIAICEAARQMVPTSMTVPSLIAHSVLECTESVKLYEHFRQDIIEVEGPNSIALLSLDSVMARLMFDHSPVETTRILTLCAIRAEKCLGSRHPVTISAWIRKGQALKRIVESGRLSDIKAVQNQIQEAIRCLNKAMVASELAPVNSNGIIIDHTSFSHHLLAILYLWNGEPGKAVAISRDGLRLVKKTQGIVHPRYLNAAFLHAKLLEGHAAAVRDPVEAVQTAREAVEILEEILDSLLDLSASVPDEKEREFQSLYGPDVMDSEKDMKRKLAITALILKLNVWLLDAAVASDLLDLVVANQLSGTRGVLVLPNRAQVRDAVIEHLQTRMDERPDSVNTLPVLELSAQLPQDVLTCCNMALVAKSKGKRVSDWFESYRVDTLRQIGQIEPQTTVNKDLLVILFISFVYITCSDGVYIGPLSLPLVPRKQPADRPTSQGKIYSEWETGATLYNIDHGLYDANPN